jgi:hypothetical protein
MIPEHIMKVLREARDKDPNDSSWDKEILSDSPRELLDLWLRYIGISGYTTQIMEVVTSVYGIDLDALHQAKEEDLGRYKTFGVPKNTQALNAFSPNYLTPPVPKFPAWTLVGILDFNDQAVAEAFKSIPRGETACFLALTEKESERFCWQVGELGFSLEGNPHRNVHKQYQIVIRKN